MATGHLLLIRRPIRRHTCRVCAGSPTVGFAHNRIKVPSVHQQVEDVVGSYLELVDALAGGLVIAFGRMAIVDAHRRYAER